MINFLQYRKFCFAFSFGLMLLGLLFYFHRGFVFGIDFTGGTEARVRFENPVDISRVRSSIERSLLWKEFAVQAVDGDRDFVVRITDTSSSVEKSIQTVFTENFAQDNPFKITSVEFVGPEAGAEVCYDALVGILLMLLFLALYIAWRQNFAYAIGATVALAHDALVVLVYYLVTGEKITLAVLMGVLAILGYSLNDTIVIFSRIQENYKLLRKDSFESVVNISINSTMTRTLLTSFTTLVSALSMYFIGGAALRDFSVTMVIGILFGTYSSIYLASPVMMFIHERFGQKNQVASADKPFGKKSY